MSSSLRARRMARNHRRMAKPARLNLVALMDIFTILVLFLMVNNGDVEVLQSDREITLPDSLSEQRPELALTLKVSTDSIRLQGREIALADELLTGDEPLLAPLQEELQQQAAIAGELPEELETRGRSVIIMGDAGLPFELLKRVMATCAASDYRDIALAVNSDPLPAAELEQLAALQGGVQ